MGTWRPSDLMDEPIDWIEAAMGALPTARDGMTDADIIAHAIELEKLNSGG